MRAPDFRIDELAQVHTLHLALAVGGHPLEEPKCVGFERLEVVDARLQFVGDQVHRCGAEEVQHAFREDLVEGEIEFCRARHLHSRADETAEIGSEIEQVEAVLR